MVKVFEDIFPAGTQGTKKSGFYLDGMLHENLKTSKEAIKADWDMLFVVDGLEGGGKSVLTQQMAFFCDPSMNLNRVVFNADDFRRIILASDKYQAVIFDEGYAGLSSRGAMSAVNKVLTAMLTEIRQKNLFIFIVLPSFFDLDRYVALWRSRALIHIHTDGFKRGFFKFYSAAKKKELYIEGKKHYNYNAVAPNFIGRFTNFYPLGAEEYQRRKKDSLKAYSNEDNPLNKQDFRAQIMREVVIQMYQQEKFNLTKQDIADVLGIHRNTVYKHLEGVQPAPTTR